MAAGQFGHGGRAQAGRGDFRNADVCRGPEVGGSPACFQPGPFTDDGAGPQLRDDPAVDRDLEGAVQDEGQGRALVTLTEQELAGSKASHLWSLAALHHHVR